MKDRNKPATLDQEGGRLLLGYTVMCVFVEGSAKERSAHG